MRMARPAHPGQFIRMEIIEPLDLSVTRAAELLDVSRQQMLHTARHVTDVLLASLG